ncbi:GNAT family N-acetyltransferase [Heyndrickxia vini]|uniref:GNAT family N-acetyltransferase n=1 Tax=Heyndrickxia vini TaxID=1476025 RepID=A0ABX7E2F1_9BACI|nr:GNAT family protein [Heyndrickxia vini]QQZ09894.1 GNAT family N-acetyltransferase [Heyndrickxia vini]
MFPVLETERLLLREIINVDAGDIFSCFSNEQVTRYYGQESFVKVDQAEQLIQLFAKNYKEKRGLRWGMERKGTKGLIGTIGLNAWSPTHKRAEIGYELHPDFWRKGYAKEAIAEIVTYGLEELGLMRIGAVVFLENTASNELLLKMGFQHEGVLKNYIHQNGQSYDTNVYGLCKDVEKG